MVGRRMNGTSMEPLPKSRSDENNLFDFTDDAQGLHCPIGSHIRRSNPRSTGSETPEGSLKVTLRHRILRRGRNYRDATPTSGTIYRGGSGEELDIEVRVEPVDEDSVVPAVETVA